MRISSIAPLRNGPDAPKLRRAAQWAKENLFSSVFNTVLTLVAAARCDLASAETALERAGARGPSRETLLGAQEIALRRGRRAAVAAFVERARQQPGAAGDGWLTALAEASGRAPRCP